MLKLLRNVRKNLLNTGALKKYLLYALGEIFLVMIGILLALEVNNWNSNRLDKQKEQKILVDLFAEFRLNKVRILEKQNLRLSIVPELKRYMKGVSEGTATYEVFKHFHSLQYVVGTTNPSRGVIDALITSGDLELISNDSLKYLLADWKDQAGNLLENEQILFQATLDYMQSFEQVIIDHRLGESASDLSTISAFESLKTNILYRNRLVSYDECQKVIIQECSVVLASLDRITRLIAKEMKIR
jgi:Family of unknown function (DUF6090)